MAALSYRLKRKSKIPLTIVTASTAQSKRLKCEHLQVSLPQQQELTAGEEVSVNSIDTQDNDARDLFTISDECGVSEEVSSHTKRKQKAAEKWKELLSASVDAIIEDQCLPRGVACYICETQDIAVRCIECGPLHYYCEQCATTLHKHGFYHHCPEIWREGYYVPLVLPVPLLPQFAHKCDTVCRRHVTCFNVEGIPHVLSIPFCRCESDTVQLIRLRYWPATPSRPSIAFTFSLLDWLEALLLECQVAVQDATQAIVYLIQERVQQMPCQIYPVLIDAFEEYRFIKGRVTSLECISPELSKKIVCPACPKNGGMLTISVDALFGLCRKKAAGSSVHDPLNGTVVFENQSEVDQFIDNYKSKPENIDTNECNNFLAGSALRSRTRFKALDETGIMGTVCRHEVPGKMFSLRHGERIGYAVLIMEKLRQHFPNHDNIQLMYDIACTLKKHLQANGRTDLTEVFELAIPIFHAYGHKLECQIGLGPRNIVGFGLSDGEGMERLWSYMRRFSAMTKEMRPSHRIDVLTDAIVFYAKKTVANFGNLFSKRIKHAYDVQRQSQETLNQLIKATPEPVTIEDVNQWLQEEMRQFTSESSTSRSHDHCDWREGYILCIDSYLQLRERLSRCDEELSARSGNSLVKKLQLVANKLQSFESSHKLPHRWLPGCKEYEAAKAAIQARKRSALRLQIQTLARERWFLLALKSKYADGHALATRLSRRITAVSQQLKKRLISFNEGLPQQQHLAWQTANDLSVDTQLIDRVADSSRCTIPSEFKHQAVRQLILSKRSGEEIKRLKEEMSNCLLHYEGELRFLHSLKQKFEAENLKPIHRVTLGSVSLIAQRIFKTKMKLRRLTNAFKQWIAVPSHILSATDPLPVATEVEMVAKDISMQLQNSDLQMCSTTDSSEIDEEGDNVKMADENISIRQPNIELNICSIDDSESDEEDDDEFENAGSVSKDILTTSGQCFQECQPARHDDQLLNDPEGSDSDEDYPQDQYWRINRLEREEFLQHSNQQTKDDILDILTEEDKRVLPMIKSIM